MNIITYKNHQIRYKFLEEVTQKNLKLPQAWFVSVIKIYPFEGYPYLGVHWLKSDAEAIDWGKRLIDAEVSKGDTYSIVFEPLHPGLRIYNPDQPSISY